MPDMIFPTQEATETTAEYLGKVKTLDHDFIAQRLASLREAGGMPAEVLEHFKSKRGEGAEKSEDKDDDKKDDESEDKGEEDNTDPEFIKKALNDMDALVATGGGSGEPCACGEEGCPECAHRLRGASANAGRKVTFTDADLTAEAVQRDIDAGNHVMAQARLAARQMRRERLAQRIASTAQAQAEKTQRLAQRSEFRAQVVAEVSAAQQRVATAKANAPKAATASVKAGYKSPSQMAATERQIIAQRMAASGEFPEEFIEAALLEATAQRSAEEEAGREIMASAMSETAKRIAMREIVANLSPESRNRAIEYWTKDLSYGDKDWVKDLFSAKYD
jgi:hypothetical protein